MFIPIQINIITNIEPENNNMFFESMDFPFHDFNFDDFWGQRRQPVKPEQKEVKPKSKSKQKVRKI